MYGTLSTNLGIIYGVCFHEVKRTLTNLLDGMGQNRKSFLVADLIGHCRVPHDFSDGGSLHARYFPLVINDRLPRHQSRFSR